MENNLYYPPTIEEFYVGFEYERLWLHVEPPMWGKIASKELNVNFTNISSCCRGKQKTSYGYIWKFKN